MSTIANAALTVKELGSDPNTDITIFFEALDKAIGAPQAAEICKAISDALKFQYVVCTMGDLKDLSRPVIKDVFEQAKAPAGWLAFIEKALSHSFSALASMHEMNNDSGDTDGQSEPTTGQARVFAPPAQGGAKVARFMGSTTLTLGLRMQKEKLLKDFNLPSGIFCRVTTAQPRLTGITQAEMRYISKAIVAYTACTYGSVHVDNLYCELAARAVEKVCPKVLCQGRKAASGKTEKPHTWPDIIHNKFINARKKNAPVRLLCAMWVGGWSGARLVLVGGMGGRGTCGQEGTGSSYKTCQVYCGIAFHACDSVVPPCFPLRAIACARVDVSTLTTSYIYAHRVHRSFM